MPQMYHIGKINDRIAVAYRREAEGFLSVRLVHVFFFPMRRESAKQPDATFFDI